jgi:hypothetical protein
MKTLMTSLKLLFFATFVLFLVSIDFRGGFKESSPVTFTDLTINSLSLSCPAPVPILQTRNDMGSMLLNEGFVSGVELGVQRGYYAADVLKQWLGCQEYVLVDLWAKQDNYVDSSNVDDTIQNERLNIALASTNPWKDIISVCRNYTTACALNYADNHFDWVYVDARHDRQGVTEDMKTWWPKIRNGGLMCGHDFVTQFEGPMQTNQRFDINGDGTVDPTGGAVKGAVVDWAILQNRQIQIAYKEEAWWTWCIRK